MKHTDSIRTSADCSRRESTGRCYFLFTANDGEVLKEAVYEIQLKDNCWTAIAAKSEVSGCLN